MGGCYKDRAHRALSVSKGEGYTIAGCAKACDGYAFFALQYHGHCFCENNWNSVRQYGTANAMDCGTDKRGGGWTNAVFMNGRGCSRCKWSSCASGYYPQTGDIPGWIGDLRQVKNCNECAQLCSDNDNGNCLSYECAPTQLCASHGNCLSYKCNLNDAADPTADPYGDYAFCTKQDCAAGYSKMIGDIRGWGTVDGSGGGQQVSNCHECGKLCSDRANCLSYECSPTQLKCNLNSADNPTAGAWGDYAF